jgi:rubrerythrin
LAKNFKDLSEQEILALAISLEETDARVYADFAAGFKADYPATAKIFEEMEAEEDEHRRKLIEGYCRRFGEHIPLIRREDVKGFVHRKPVWMIRPLGIKMVRRQTEIMETETRRFYERAASKASDASTRKLLGDLAEAERKHVTLADNLQQEYLTPEVEAQEEKAHRPIVRSANRAAWTGGTDGWFGLHPCASFCGSVCDLQQPRRLRGRSRRQCWSGNFNGVR